MFSPRLLHAYPVAVTRLDIELPDEPVCEKKFFATMSCVWASAAWPSSGLHVSAAAGAKLPLPQLAPAARAWLMRANATAAKSGMPQVDVVLLDPATGELTPGDEAPADAPDAESATPAGAAAGASLLLPPPPHAASTSNASGAAKRPSALGVVDAIGAVEIGFFMEAQAIGGAAWQG